jgi:predicted LPLAT superfamily acyltransferase
VAYFFLTDAPGRRASLAYLRRVWSLPAGRASLGRRPGLRESFRHYLSFAIAIVDRFSVWFDSKDEFEFETTGTELIDRYAAENRGVLILGAHFGNFDALRRLAERSGQVVNVLMYTENSKRINQIFEEVSPEMRERMIVVDPDSVQSVFMIRERLLRGEHVAILADRVEPGLRHRTLEVGLLGGLVKLPCAPMELAGVLGCPVVMVLATRRDSGRYRVVIEALDAGAKLPRDQRPAAVERVMKDYARRLEQHCCSEPYQWFNFYDYWGDVG